MVVRINEFVAVECGTAIKTDGRTPLEIRNSRAINCRTFIDAGGANYSPQQKTDVKSAISEKTETAGSSFSGFSSNYGAGYSAISWNIEQERHPMKVTNNVVTGTDTFYRGPDNDATIFDGNHFRDGKIFLDVRGAASTEDVIHVPEGMTRDNLVELVKLVAEAIKDGSDAEEAAKRSPWFERLLAAGANGATLITALIASAQGLG